MKVKSLSHVRLLATPWTAAYQAPPFMGFCRQEYWSGVPLPSLIYLYIYIKSNLWHGRKQWTFPQTSEKKINKSKYQARNDKCKSPVWYIQHMEKRTNRTKAVLSNITEKSIVIDFTDSSKSTKEISQSYSADIFKLREQEKEPHKYSKGKRWIHSYWSEVPWL